MPIPPDEKIQTAGSPAQATATRPSLIKRGIVVLFKLTVVGVGLFLLLLVVVAVGMKKPAANGTGSTARVTATMTKQEWMAKVIKELGQDRTTVYAGYINCSAKDFYRVMGEPIRTQAVGENAYLYYQCTDGTLQLVCYKVNLESNGLLGTTAINEY